MGTILYLTLPKMSTSLSTKLGSQCAHIKSCGIITRSTNRVEQEFKMVLAEAVRHQVWLEFEDLRYHFQGCRDIDQKAPNRQTSKQMKQNKM